MKVREIAEFLGGEARGDGEIDIVSVADLAIAGQGEIAFLAMPDPRAASNASCVILSDAEGANFPCTISVQDPKLAFAKVAAILHPSKTRIGGNHASAVISETAVIGESVFIGAFVCVGENSIVGNGTQLRAGAKVGDNVQIGARCVLHPNVFIDDGCIIGDNVVIHPGSVIGADGFGYVQNEQHEHVKFPQIGIVVIEDNVEIGANSCVDRGALGETRIGSGSKIDNLVQIAHNVKIGRNCIIVAMSGISGSSILEDNVVLAGQVGIADHVTLKQGVVIAAKSAVFPNKIISEGVWAGIPARPISEFNAGFAELKKLARNSIRSPRSRVSDDKQ